MTSGARVDGGAWPAARAGLEGTRRPVPGQLGRVGLCFLTCAVLLTALGTASCREQRRDPVTGRIRIIYIGDPGPGSPYPVYTRDPLTEVVPVIAIGFTQPDTVIRRYMRLYMPRNQADLVDSYDIVIISDASKRFFTTDHMAWFRNSVIDGGLTLIMIGGYETFGSTIYTPGSWGDTSVAEALPVVCLDQKWEDKSGVLEVSRWDDPLMKSVPFKEIGPYGIFYGCNIVQPKESVSPLAYYRVTGTGVANPLFCYWEVGAGSSYAMTTDWTPAGGRDFLRWAYYPDYVLNLATYVTGGNVPTDVEIVHQARSLMAEFRDLRQTLDSLIDFASKFGANMAPAEKLIGDAGAAKAAGERSYVDGDMEASIDGLRSSLDILDSASRKAYQLKDQAMLWVYLTEWLVVASTGMVCGFILWTVMVRRRLYRAVRETRLHQAE